MENVKGMFSRKYGGVPAWIILLIAVGGVYLYMRHTGSSLFGGSSSSTDPNADPGSTGTMDGQSPEIVFVPATDAGSGSATNPNNNHPAGPPPTHTITAAQRAAAIMKDFRAHGLEYFKNHPGALAFLKANAPKDYAIVHRAQTGKPPPKKSPIRGTTVSGKPPARQQPHAGTKKAA